MTASSRTGWTSAARAVVYWCVAVLSVAGGAISWLWLYLATEEATRGATPDRTGPNPNTGIGITGLIVGHLLGLLALVITALWARQNRNSAAWFVGVPFAAGSLIGLTLSLTLTGGALLAPWPQQPYQP